MRTPLQIVVEAKRPSPAVRGILLAVFSGAFFAMMHGLVRSLSRELDAMEIAFFRALFGFLFFTPVLMRSRLRVLKTRRLPMHLVRGVFNGGSLLCWFTALSLVPLADATALSLAGPVVVTVGAVLFLGERAHGMRWLAVGLGVAGGLVIIRPGFTVIDYGMVLVLISIVLVSTSRLMAKSLARTDEAATIVAYLSLLMTVPSGIAALFVWQTPSLEQLGLLVLIGFLGSSGHMLITTAYRIADISAVEPAVFARLGWAALVGWLLFAEFPGVWIWAGAALIGTASVLLARSETRRSGGPGGPQAPPAA